MMLTTIYFLVIVKVTPYLRHLSVMTGLRSHSAAELRLLCFQDIIEIPFSSNTETKDVRVTQRWMRTWTLKGVLGTASVLSTKISIPKTSAQKSCNPGAVQIYHSLTCLTESYTVSSLHLCVSSSLPPSPAEHKELLPVPLVLLCWQLLPRVTKTRSQAVSSRALPWQKRRK